jgi:hypothetical protein
VTTRTMQDLISSSYSKDEAIRFSQYITSQADKETIVQAGSEILKSTPKLPYACALMSAMWGAFIRDNTHIPTHVVAGNLLINSRKVFFNDDSSEKIRQVFETSNYSWDGHVWVSFAGTIGDISIFRSAYSEPENHWLHRLVVQEFGQGRGLVLGSPLNMTYEAKYILTDNQITALIKGFRTMIEGRL